MNRRLRFVLAGIVTIVLTGCGSEATQAIEKALSLAEKAGPEAVQSTTWLRDGINLYIHATPDERKELKSRMKMK